MDNIGKLVIGSKAIDQMRQEIDAVIGMTIGLLKNRDLYSWKDSAWPNPAKTVFTGSDHWWIISDRSDGKICLRVECWLTYPYGESLVYSNFDGIVLTMWEVQRVYRALSTFVEGMKRTFNLADSLQILMDAADYAEKNGWQL